MIEGKNLLIGKGTNMDIKLLTERDRMKYEIAEELGLLDKVHEKGWKGLSAKESGKIGGIMTSRMRKNREKKNNSED